MSRRYPILIDYEVISRALTFGWVPPRLNDGRLTVSVHDERLFSQGDLRLRVIETATVTGSPQLACMFRAVTGVFLPRLGSNCRIPHGALVRCTVPVPQSVGPISGDLEIEA